MLSCRRSPTGPSYLWKLQIPPPSEMSPPFNLFPEWSIWRRSISSPSAFIKQRPSVSPVAMITGRLGEPGTAWVGVQRGWWWWWGREPGSETWTLITFDNPPDGCRIGRQIKGVDGGLGKDYSHSWLYLPDFNVIWDSQYCVFERWRR